MPTRYDMQDRYTTAEHAHYATLQAIMGTDDLAIAQEVQEEYERTTERDALVKDVFGRVREDGNVQVCSKAYGLPATRMPRWTCVWPENSSLSCAHEHPEGLVLNPDQAKEIGLTLEH